MLKATKATKKPKETGLNLSLYKPENYEGEILSVERGKRREFVDEEFWPKFIIKDKESGEEKNTLDDDVLHLEMRIQDQFFGEEFTVPKMSGYSRSNLKKMVDKNPNLSDLPDTWPGQKVKLKLETKGQTTFFRVAL